MKGSFEFDPEATKRKGMEAYCALCGWALALAHAKSGDAAMIAGFIGQTDEIDEALTKFADAYAKQNEQDYAELQKAAREKRIEVAETA
jgi:NAD(P)H-dependent flavin oxidoreductase YrpB (nitropropane dioxygenase family)